MILNMRGDIFQSSAEALVNPVNTVGVMGAGLALEFKKQFPNNFILYQKACAKGLVKTGEMFITKFDNYPYIVNFPTKQHWKNPSKAEWIEEGCVDLLKQLETLEIAHVALPMLGCGLGGLQKEQVKSILDHHFTNTVVRVELYS